MPFVTLVKDSDPAFYVFIQGYEENPKKADLIYRPLQPTAAYFYQTDLARVFVAVIKHHGLREERFYLFRTIPLRSHGGKSERGLKVGAWRQELKQPLWRNRAYWLEPLRGF